MSGNNLFIDTNIALYLLGGDKTLAETLHGKQIYLSVITELELLAFNGITKKEEKIIREFIAQCKVIGINEMVKEATIRIRKQYKTKLPDSIIMATAAYLDLPIITADSGFKVVDELMLIFYEK